MMTMSRTRPSPPPPIQMTLERIGIVEKIVESSDSCMAASLVESQVSFTIGLHAGNRMFVIQCCVSSPTAR